MAAQGGTKKSGGGSLRGGVQRHTVEPAKSTVAGINAAQTTRRVPSVESLRGADRLRTRVGLGSTVVVQTTDG